MRQELRNELQSDQNLSLDHRRGAPTDAGHLMPGQYDDLVRRRTAIEGEQRLMLAVLEDAVRCYLRHAGRVERQHRREYVEVCRWFGLGGTAWRSASSPFDFENLCLSLGIEASRLVENLKRLTLDDLPARRYQTRRHRPLSSLRNTGSRSRKITRVH